MSLLGQVAALLDRARIPYALIGAVALAIHGVSRSTIDLDLLTTDTVVLDASCWRELPQAVQADIRRGEDDDPLAGVVRLRTTGERDVDVVVGRGQWQRALLDRSLRVPTADGELPVVTPADLVLLKLYAGGNQDKWDIEQLLALDGAARLKAEIEERLSVLPSHAQRLWAATFRSTR